MGRHHRLTRRRRNIERVYAVARLWKLSESFESFSHPLTALDLSSQVWFHGRCPSIEEVIQHYDKVLAADLDYPILLDADGRVMDGYHRIVKARLQGDTTISAVRFPVTPTADEVRWVDSQPRPVGAIAQLVADVTLELQRELDDRRVALAQHVPAARAQAWSEQALKFLDDAEDRLTEWSRRLHVNDFRPSTATRALRHLDDLRDAWFFDSRFPDLIALADAEHEPLRLGGMLLETVDRLRVIVEPFATA